MGKDGVARWEIVSLGYSKVVTLSNILCQVSIYDDHPQWRYAYSVVASLCGH